MKGCRPSLLILYTGGTIGMRSTDNGLAPASGFEARIRECFVGQIYLDLPPWEFVELLPLIDSANITPTHWLRIRKEIVDAVQKRNVFGILVLHGTDTLAYSAAALSFLLLGLDVPVVFTGSLLPADVSGSDAWENLIGSLKVLAGTILPGVYLYFHGDLFHGAHCSKLRSFGRNPFICLPHQSGKGHTKKLPDKLKYDHTKISNDIAVMPLFPGISAQHLYALIDSGIRGLVLECYGSGTGPCNDEVFLTALRTAIARGITLFAVSQCLEDKVNLELYEAGIRLYQVGVISGGSMTREAAVGKLQMLIGTGLSQGEVAYWLTQDLCGELF